MEENNRTKGLKQGFPGKRLLPGIQRADMTLQYPTWIKDIEPKIINVFKDLRHKCKLLVAGQMPKAELPQDFRWVLLSAYRVRQEVGINKFVAEAQSFGDGLFRVGKDIDEGLGGAEARFEWAALLDNLEGAMMCLKGIYQGIIKQRFLGRK